MRDEAMEHYQTWEDAHKAALRLAKECNLDTRIRKASKYDVPGFTVGFACKNDSDYAMAEIVRPSDPWRD